MTENELNGLTKGIIGVAIEVHRELGPGLLDRVYKQCLRIALEQAGYSIIADLRLPVMFRGQYIDSEGYSLDLLVNDTVVLEIKSVSSLTLLHEKQLSTYLRLADKPCGLLLNFNTAFLKEGIKRSMNGFLPL
ncbi:MAG: GxxExxY protein [Clostridiales bacterium]|jgi:GxxExxY protein|nr:GxxExxY protein [Clostridiales bacterium]